MIRFMMMRRYLNHYLAAYPRLFMPLYKYIVLRGNAQHLVSNDTDIVIEGYPRCGNTFAVIAFRQAQPERVKVAHHLHAEAQVLEGIRLQLPVLVLIRRPEEAVRSLLVRHPEVNPNFALKRYIRFYSIVYQVWDRVVIGDFNKVVSDFGQVIRAVNEQFGSNFGIFQHTEQNVASVFRRIEAVNLYFDQGKETHVARPSLFRRAEYEKPELQFSAPLQDKAAALYHALSGN